MAKSDLVICMEAGHVEALHAEFPEFRDKTRFFSEIAGRKYSISDPYGKPIEEYEAMVKEVEKLLDFGMASIVQWARDGEAARQTAF
jgi:protein-tyrosine-phosphatase